MHCSNPKLDNAITSPPSFCTVHALFLVVLVHSVLLYIHSLPLSLHPASDQSNLPDRSLQLGGKLASTLTKTPHRFWGEAPISSIFLNHYYFVLLLLLIEAISLVSCAVIQFDHCGKSILTHSLSFEAHLHQNKRCWVQGDRCMWCTVLQRDL